MSKSYFPVASIELLVAKSEFEVAVHCNVRSWYILLSNLFFPFFFFFLEVYFKLLFDIIALFKCNKLNKKKEKKKKKSDTLIVCTIKAFIQTNVTSNSFVNFL